MLKFSVIVMTHNNFCLEIYKKYTKYTKSIQRVCTVVINTLFP